MSNKNNNKNNTKNLGEKIERKLAYEREQNAAKHAVSVSAEEFRVFGEAVETSATSATEAMLNQAQLVFDVSEKYKASRFDTDLLNFRSKTKLKDASKWCQFRVIGRFAQVLRPVASQLPSGWTSLYALASALKRKDKAGDPITIETLFMIQENGSPKLNGYSTQSEVRRIVHQAQGKQLAKKKDAAPPTLTVAFGINAQTVSNEDIAEVEQFLRDALRTRFPIIADVVSVKTNKVLRFTLEAQLKKAA